MVIHDCILTYRFTLFPAAPSDYIAVTKRTVTLNNTKLSECIDVEIVPDDLFEMDESFIVTLNSTDSSAVLNPDETEIMIKDEDGMPLLVKSAITILQYWLKVC